MRITNVAAMSLIEPASPVVEEELPPGLVEVGFYPSERAASEHGLVVLAMGRPYWTVATGSGQRLLIEAEVALPAKEQLLKFDRENLNWPPPAFVERVTYPTDVITPLLWAALVLGIYHLQGTRPGWTAAGALDSEGIFGRGEWWRLGTALWLHGDGAHAISNALSGVLLFTAVVKTFGRAAGWGLVALAAVLANLLVAALAFPVAYRSLGASTAIFAGVGLLTGRSLRVLTRAEHPHRNRAILVALASGVTVLALYGAGGGAPQVDIGAHVAGFVVGVGVGFAAARPSD